MSNLPQGRPGSPSPASRRATPLLCGAAIAAGWLLAIAAGKALDGSVTTWLTSDGVRRPLTDGIGTLLNVAVYVCFPAVFLALPNWKRLFVGWNAALLLSTLLTHLLKWMVGRARPYAEQGALAYVPFSDAVELNSFPSGHTSSAVTIAALAGIFFPRFRLVFWFYALVVALERLVSRNHFLSDVIAGAGIGLFSVWLARKSLGPTFFDSGVR